MTEMGRCHSISRTVGRERCASWLVMLHVGSWSLAYPLFSPVQDPSEEESQVGLLVLVNLASGWGEGVDCAAHPGVLDLGACVGGGGNL